MLEREYKDIRNEDFLFFKYSRAFSFCSIKLMSNSRLSVLAEFELQSFLGTLENILISIKNEIVEIRETKIYINETTALKKLYTIFLDAYCFPPLNSWIIVRVTQRDSLDLNLIIKDTIKRIILLSNQLMDLTKDN